MCALSGRCRWPAEYQIMSKCRASCLPAIFAGPLVHMRMKKAVSWAASVNVLWVWQLVEGSDLLIDLVGEVWAA